MPLFNLVRTLLDRKGLRFLLVFIVNQRARSKGKGVNRVLWDKGVWIYETSDGYFASPKPVFGVDMPLIDKLVQMQFLWGYTPRDGDVIVDIGAGVGEEVLTFSRKVGKHGKVVSVEAHPRTYLCLKKLVELNNLVNVVTIHQAITEPCRPTVNIENSSDYLLNRSSHSTGIVVSATTIDLLCQKLKLKRINFLKMNIEGAERLAINGMKNTVKHTEVLCISCHDFLANITGDECYRTKSVIKAFLCNAGLRLVERRGKDLPPYVADQVWAYNDLLRTEANSWSWT